MIPSLAAIAAWLFLAQDTVSVQDLVARLGHEDIEQRVLAMRGLIRRSEAAVPGLKAALASDDLEVAQRAQLALSRIEELVLLRPVYKERVPFTLDLQGVPLDQALERIAGAAAVSFRVSPFLARRTVTVKMAEGTLLQALDLLCRDLGDTQWSYVDPDVIAFRSRPYIPKPAFYADCFRISLKRIESHRTSDFAEGTGTAALFLDARVEQGIQFLGTPSFSITEAVDENGNELTEWLHPLAGADSRLGEAGPALTEPPGAESRIFCFSGIGASARRLRLVRGTTTFTFAMGSEETVLDDLSGCAPQEIGDCKVEVLQNGGGILKLAFSRNDQPVDLAWFQTDSVVVVDEEGDRHPLGPMDCDCYQHPENRVTVLTLYFDRAWKTQATRASFRWIRDVHVMKIPFEFRDVPLP